MNIRLRHSLALCLLAVVSLILVTPAAHAGGTLTVGVENQYYLPISSYDKGEYKGFARDLLDAFGRDRGYQMDYRALPVPRLYASFFAKQLDLKFPDNPNWQGDARTGKSIVYSDSVAAFIDGVSVRPEHKNITVGEMRVIGTVSGFTPWAWSEQIKSGKTRLAENPSLDALVRQALAGRVDGAYASVAVINYHLDHVLMQPGALRFHGGLPASRDNYFLSSITKPEVIREFSAWMKQNRKLVGELKKKHGVEKGVVPE